MTWCIWWLSGIKECEKSIIFHRVKGNHTSGAMMFHKERATTEKFIFHGPTRYTPLIDGTWNTPCLPILVVGWVDVVIYEAQAVNIAFILDWGEFPSFWRILVLSLKTGMVKGDSRARLNENRAYNWFFRFVNNWHSFLVTMALLC